MLFHQASSEGKIEGEKEKEKEKEHEHETLGKTKVENKVTMYLLGLDCAYLLTPDFDPTVALPSSLSYYWLVLMSTVVVQTYLTQSIITY